MKATNSAIVFLTIALLLTPAMFLTIPVSATFPSSPPPWRGPKADRVVIKIYSNDEAEALALQAGEIDLMDWDVPASKVDEFIVDPDINLLEFDDLGMYQIDINHRVLPTSDLQFRRAVAMLVNKTYIVRDVMEGYGTELASPVPPVLTGWTNTYLNNSASSKANFWYYEYNTTAALQTLLDAGYTQPGGDLYYPNTVDYGDYAGLRVNCTLYIRQDDAYRKAAGEALRDELIDLGVDVYAPVVEKSVCYDRVMIEYNYSLYTGGWNLAFDPDHLYDFYHADMDTYPDPWSYNYPGFDNESYNYWAAQLKFNSSIDACLEGAWRAQEVFAEQVATIPLYAKKGVIAASSWYDDVINGVGGIQQSYAWAVLRMHHNSTPYGGTINWGFKSNIESLNPIHAEWVWDWQVLNLVFDGLFVNDPYDPSKDLPIMASSWTIDEYELNGYTGTDNGTMGLNITYTLLDNVTWHDGEPCLADDVVFFYEFMSSIETPSRWLPTIANVASAKAKGDYVVEVILNTTSYFGFHFSSPLPIPKHLWENHYDDWQSFEPSETGELIGNSAWKFVEWIPGEYVILEANRDYYWVDPDRPKYISATLPERSLVGAIETVNCDVQRGSTAIANASVTLDIIKPGEGTLVRYWLSNTTSLGNYTAQVNMPSEAGTYLLKLTAVFELGGVVYNDALYQALTVEASIDPMLLMMIGLPVAAVVGFGAGFLIFRRRSVV